MLAAFGAIGGNVNHTALPTRNDATVVSLSVVPATGRADVVIRVEGAITLQHFTLQKPDKIVVDLNGATLGLPQGDAYDGISRGGITRIRYSQFTKTVVRVVLTLDASHPYEVTQKDGEVHVTVDGATEQFDAWRIGQSLAMVEPAPAAVRPEVAPTKVSSRDAKPVAKSSMVKNETKPSFDEHAIAIMPTGPQSQEPRVTVNWENTSIADVLGLLSAYSGRTILPSKNVVGTVTANIINQPWDVVLKSVMNANGYDVTINSDGIIVVDTFEAIAARQATIPLITHTVRLNYARAAAAAPMVSARLSRSCTATTVSQAAAAQASASNTPPSSPVTTTTQSLTCPTRGAVTADTITNSVSITDVPSALPELEAYTRSLDLRQPQVNIKARIISVDRSTIEGLGLRYDLGTANQFFNDIIPRTDSAGTPLSTPGQVVLGGNTVSAIANAQARIPSAALQLIYSTAMGNFDFTTFLEALQTNTLLDVQAEPSVTVLNNRLANLTAGTQVPIRIIDAGAGGNQTSNFPRAAVSFQQTGIIIQVTPQITNNRQVQMKLHVENSDVQFQANDVGAVFPKQQVDNEVLVADGETTVMAGLTQTSVSVSKTGLPVLVDLPIIGRLFGVTNRTETKRDLIILITPHIIDDGQQPDTGKP
jgi:type IV pilus assembly protein PilQ